MYQMSQVRPEQLANVTVPNQNRIEELTGQTLDLGKAYDYLKKESQEFKKDDSQLIEIDKLFTQLLQLQGIKIEAKDDSSIELKMKLRERERARAIEILALKLDLAA